MTDKSQAYFQELNEKEKTSKLFQLARTGRELTIWEKGSPQRESFKAQEFNPDFKRILCLPPPASSLGNKQVLYSFELNGLFFFGKGELKAVGNGLNSLECQGKLYKSERRGAFRLLTFPHHKVFLHLKIAAKELEESNVIGFKTGMSETGIFKRFLSLIGEKEGDGKKSGEEENLSYEGHFRFRALDISVTGAAFQVGEMELKHFPKHKRTGKIHLEFNGKKETVPDAEVVYRSALAQKNKNHKAYKIGLKFKDVDLNLDQSLGRLINGAIRDFETEFEDFLK